MTVRADDRLESVFAQPAVDVERREDGAILLRSKIELGEYPPTIAHVFRARAEAHPERLLATEPHAGGRREISWGDARLRVDRLAEGLLAASANEPRPRPLLVLSGNSIEHLLLTLAAYTAGVPVVPVSTAYSLTSRDHRRLRILAGAVRPQLVFADDADAYGPALEALAALVPRQLTSAGAGGTEALAALERAPGQVLAQALDGLGPETVAKLMFTSGSTGMPKGVVTTQGMMCSNQQALGAVWPFLRTEPPVLVDWLPWSHVFGGSHNLNMVLTYGGTMHIDDGRPAPALFERSLDAIRRTPPTVYCNVPAGYALLVPALERDRDLAVRLCSRLRFMLCAAAALPEDLWRRLHAVVGAVAERPIPLTCSWGATETAPAATTAHDADAPAGCIGVPLPGTTVKLVPTEGKLEARIAGPNVTPGYFGDPNATATAFDEEGFYRTGDAVTFVADGDPASGLAFAGRIAENFKLSSGTWVSVGRLRTTLVSAARVLSDAVIAGHDREFVAAAAWLNQAEARTLLGRDGDVALDDPALRAHLLEVLRTINAGKGASLRIARLMLLREPPDPDAGEITDKAYINQRQVLERRRDVVERLFTTPIPDDVIGMPSKEQP